MRLHRYIPAVWCPGDMNCVGCMHLPASRRLRAPVTFSDHHGAPGTLVMGSARSLQQRPHFILRMPEALCHQVDHCPIEG